jgi:two-component system nitrogen regulation response regulator NtrX
VPTILIIDDEPNIRRMVGALLASEGYDVREAANAHAGIATALDAEPDVALVDLMMPGDLDGMGVLKALHEQLPQLPVVMMSGRAGLSDAVRATKLGAFTFLEKPLTPEGVLLALGSALELRRARREAATLRAEIIGGATLIGDSEPMERVRDLIARIGPTDSRVLITGESGTGKELVASGIHDASGRRDLSFIRVNCAAIPRDLVESEMFGHERGSFTGATERRLGKFELAHKGTLFLDEVGDLGAEAQAKLLRALEAGEIERVGGSKPIPVDVRVIAATNKNLERAVRDGAFRDDLLFRLNVIPVPLPPLRERASDIPALVTHFASVVRSRSGRSLPEWSDGALQCLMRYRWPGNVRELANVVERLMILHPGQRIRVADIQEVIAAHETPEFARAVVADASDAPLNRLLDDYERALIARALSAAGGNVAEAARRLQTDRPNLYRRMKRLDIAPDSGASAPADGAVD